MRAPLSHRVSMIERMFFTAAGADEAQAGEQQFPATGELRALVCRAARTLEPETVAPDDAARLMVDWAAMEHACATAKARLGARAATGAAWRAAGAKDAGEWVARRTGTTAARARDELHTAHRLRDLPATTDAACRGELSPVQTALIADAATADPSAEEGLLAAAGRESVGELRDRCARTKAAADADPEATRRRIHAARALRRYATADGLHHLHASGPAAVLAAVDRALAPWIDARFRTARQAGERETFEARAFDALVDLADAAPAPPSCATAHHPAGASATRAPTAPAAGTAPTSPAPSTSPPPPPPSGPAAAPDDARTSPAVAARAPVPGGAPATAPARRRTPDRYKIVIRADLEALVRGTVAGDETCEIAGIGPITVSAVRDLLGTAALHLVLTKGTAVANVTHLGRGPTAAQRIALLWQAPACTRQGCARTAHLEVDHRTPWAVCHTTELANLDPLCHHDHALKTRKHWSLVAGSGRRPMVPPGHPDHPAPTTATDDDGGVPP